MIQWLRRPKPARIIPSDEWALTELSKLDNAPLDGQEPVEAFHFRMAEVLRLYCGRRWAFPSAKMTTDELNFSLEKLAPDLSAKRREALIELMEDADMVKFARYPAATLTCQERLKDAKAFVEATRPSDDDAPAQSLSNGNNREAVAA
jgi:hypothetical protein